MLAVLMDLSSIEAKRSIFLTILILELHRRLCHPVPNTPQLLQRNQPMIPQDYRQLRHCRLMLASDQGEGGFGKAQVLLEVVDEVRVVHERGSSWF
jgi:hypothetical protein